MTDEKYLVFKKIIRECNYDKVLLNNAGFEVIECGITSDIRPGGADEKWVNVILRKV